MRWPGEIDSKMSNPLAGAIKKGLSKPSPHPAFRDSAILWPPAERQAAGRGCNGVIGGEGLAGSDLLLGEWARSGWRSRGTPMGMVACGVDARPGRRERWELDRAWIVDKVFRRRPRVGDGQLWNGVG